MKKSITLFWKGLTGILAGIANWFTTILGMKDDSKYGKLLRRTVGTCFTLMVLILTIAFVICWCEEGLRYCRYHGWFSSSDDTYYSEQVLSSNATYYADYCRGKGYVEDQNGKKTIKDIRWVAMPLGSILWPVTVLGRNAVTST